MRRVLLGLVGCRGGWGQIVWWGFIHTRGLQEGELGVGGRVEEGEMRLGGEGGGGGQRRGAGAIGGGGGPYGVVVGGYLECEEAECEGDEQEDAEMCGGEGEAGEMGDGVAN